MSKKIAIIASVLHPLRQRHLLDWYQDIKAVYPTAQLFIGSKNAQVPEGVNFKINSKIEKLSYWLRGKNPHKNQPLLDFKPDIVHLLTSNAYPAIREAISPQTKLIVSYRGFDINVFPFQSKENLELTQTIFKKADVLHFISEALMNTAISIGAERHKCVVIYRSVNTKKPINKMQKNEDTTTIVSVGRLVWEKGYQTALKAISILNKKESNFKYIIAGDGVEVDNLKKLAKDLEIEDKVIFLGHVDRRKVFELLSIADIYFQPSVTEALSNAIIEASFYSLPVVSSNVGGIPEVIDNERSGFLTPVGDVEKYAESLIKLIENEDLRITMGEVGHRIICERFSRKDEIDKWLTLYNTF